MAKSTIRTLEKDVQSINERAERLHVWTKEQNDDIKHLEEEEARAREAAINTRSKIDDTNRRVDENKDDIKDLAKVVDNIMKEESWKMMKLITWILGVIGGVLGILRMAGKI